jgi:RimJ/RimL family protein N-acetyltransferase
MQYRIRKLKRSDFTAYYGNELSYYKELKSNPEFGIGTYGKKLRRSDIRASFSKLYRSTLAHKVIAIVAENKDGKMIGIGTLNGNVWYEAPHIADLGVSVIKEYRNKGIGTAIVKELLRLAKGKYEIVTAETFSRNTASKKLLRRAGFRKWGLGPRFIKRGKLYMDSELFYLKIKQ